MSSYSTVATARQKLSRLDRVMGDSRERLSTPDPLLCEIMIANTVAQLAVAEAMQEQTAALKRMNERYVPIPFVPYDVTQRRYQEKQLENWDSLLKMFDNLITYAKDIVKILRRKS